MNVLFISIAWPSPGEKNLYTDLMDEFVINGHTVCVIGTHNSDKNKEDELTVESGIRVLRIVSGKIRKTSHLRKAVSLLTLNRRILSAIKKNLGGERFDLIIGPTPSVTLSSLYRKLKMMYNAPFYLLLKDIWPQGSVDLKVLRKYGLPWIYLRSHEKRTYKTADYIGCMSQMGVDYLYSKNKYLSYSKIEVCPNCIRPSSEIPESNSGAIRSKYSIPEDACVFIFSGNLGIGHGLEFLMEAIKQLSGYKKAFFVIGGAGTQLKYLKEKMKEFSYKNLFLYDWLPREDFSGILAASDVGLILLYSYTVPQFPSRLLSYLDYSKPVLCAANNYTDMGRIIEDSGCGRSIMHGSMEQFIEAVKYFSENENERRKMGECGYKLLVRNYTAKHGYEIITNHFSN
jgi:glycosyltransferase involved in cell wall biosynthesis